MATAQVQAEPGIDAPTLYERLGFKPHSPGQSDYLLSMARFNVPCCGRRYGKSQAAGHRMTFKSFVADSYNWICAPSYKLGEKEFRVVYRDYQTLGLIKHCRKSYNVKQGDMRIVTPWNAVIEVVSADNQDSLLGEGLSHVVMSEAARHSLNTWEQYVEPALSDLLGSADFPSTPQGYNWYYGIWALGQIAANKAYKSWRFPSWENTVRYPGGFNNEEIQRIKSKASESYFWQEYGAKFTSMTGAIYEEWNEDVHVIQHEFIPEWPNYMAFDYGFSNPFVALDIQVSPSDEVYVWREYYLTHRTNQEHGLALVSRENPTGYHVDGFWGDPRDPDAALTLANCFRDWDAAKTGMVASQDVVWGNAVEYIKRMLKTRPPQLYVDQSCTNLRRQMGQLHVKEQAKQAKQDLNENTGDRNIQHKKDDHAADALRYFIGPMFVDSGMSLEEATEDSNEQYQGSEAEGFFRVHSGVTLDDFDVMSLR